MTDKTAEAPESEVLEDIVTPGGPSELEIALSERDAARNDYLRTLAEFQNFRKRAHHDQSELRKTATQELVKDLLPVLDNFERTLAAAEKGATLESLIEGIKAVDRQLRTALEKRHLKRIETVGKPFDPHLHEPLGTEATEEVAEDTVTLEIEPGYTMGDRVLRPARVRVAKKP